MNSKFTEGFLPSGQGDCCAVFRSAEPNREVTGIVSNLPAKTGKELYYLYFYDALERLNSGGKIYVVTISGLRKFVARAFGEVFGNYKKLKQGKTYTVAMANYQP